MISLGLLGSNISHSRSQEMYEGLLGLKIQYHLIDIDNEKDVLPLSQLFEKYKLRGMSITFPYKKHFIGKVIVEDPIIKNLDAINCIELKEAKFYATNTDYLAAVDLLKSKYLKRYKNFILLGSGNMAAVFEAAFHKLGLSYKQYSRSKDGDLNSLDYVSIADKDTLIINCCSRKFEFSPNGALNCGFWDMNYSYPAHNNLEQFGLKYFEGIDLLKSQAKFALEFWDMGHLIKNL